MSTTTGTDTMTNSEILDLERRKLEAVVASIKKQIPQDVNDAIRDLLFGEGGWDAATGFLTHTYPAIIEKLEERAATGSVEELLTGSIVDPETGVATIILRKGLQPYGDFDELNKANVTAEISLNNGADITQLEGIVVLDIKRFYIDLLYVDPYQYYSERPDKYWRNRKLAIGGIQSLAALTLYVPESSYVFRNERRPIYTKISIEDCPSLARVTLSSIPRHVATGAYWRPDHATCFPTFANLAQGFILDVRPAGWSKADVQEDPGYPFGIPELDGTIVCTDGEFKPLLP